MNHFGGWVRYRRGIINHVLDGRLTGHEHYALSQLILLADSSTGGDRINAPLLCYYTGYVFGQDTAQKILNSLHAKGYIWYRGKPFSIKPQPYWVNRYIPSTGPMKDRMMRIDKLLVKSTISQDDVWKCADETTDESTVETTDETTDNYKKREKRKEKKETPILIPEKVASLNDSVNASMSAFQDSSKQRTKGTGECGSVSASVSASVCASRIQYAPGAAPPSVPAWGDELPGCTFRKGQDPGYIDAATGRRLSFEEAKKMSRREETHESY